MSRTTVALSRFHVAGVNYKKTDTRIRGSFAVSPAHYDRILRKAPEYGISDLFVLSTCNRTEIYGVAESPDQLINALCAETEGDRATFAALAYRKSGIEAVRHLFDVGAGLDSQILGDYEIVGQIRAAVKAARERKYIHSFLERAVSAVIQASREIKNTTALSDGTVSVAFAAVQCIREQFPDITGKRILLVGTGKIGRNACRNLVDYLGTRDITLINRTPENARDMAGELGLRQASLEELPQEVAAADIILVATSAEEPLIGESLLRNAGEKLIIDLSIPCNVSPAAGRLANITLIDVDALSRRSDDTLQKRAAEVPKALAIIDLHLEEFLAWHDMRRHVPLLNALRSKLQEIHTSSLTETSGQPVAAAGDEMIRRIVNGMATKMRRENQGGCYYIEAINEFMTAG